MDLSILITTIPPKKKYLNRLLYNLQNQIVENSLQNQIEIIVYEDNFEYVVGYKKNKLYRLASGKYVVSIEDDDMVASNYCKSIMDVIKKYDVDQISFTHAYYNNNREKWTPIVTSKSNKYYNINFFKLIDFYVTEYCEEEEEFNRELRINNKPILKVTKNSFVKKIILFLFLYFCGKGLKKVNRHTSHTVVLKKEIAQLVSFNTNKLKEKICVTFKGTNNDVKWSTEISKKKLIKSEYIIDEVLYHYYNDNDLLIDNGKYAQLNKEEKKITLQKNLDTIKNIDWVIKPLDKIKIKWI